MNILLFGDVVGKSGRTALSLYIDQLVSEYAVDFVVANGENSAHGKGITPRIYETFVQAGVNAITLGNHAFSKQKICEGIDSMFHLVYPNNHPLAPHALGMRKFVVNGIKIAVMNILGNAFMLPQPTISCFEQMDQYLAQCESDECIIVDFHGEATAEKRVFFEQYKSRCAIIFGTHTHVQTADEMVKDGCAFISDVGMVGAYDSVLGRDIEESLQLYQGKKTRYLPSDNVAIVCGLVVKIDPITKRALQIKRIQIRPQN